MTHRKILFNPFHGYDVENCLVEPLVEANQEHDAESFQNQLLRLKYSYIYEGQIYYNVYVTQAYKEDGYTSFSSWIKDKLNTSWSKACKLVDASKIAQFLLSQGFEVLPANQSQAYTLNLLDNENNPLYPQSKQV